MLYCALSRKRQLDIDAHATSAANLTLQRQMPRETRILDRQTILAAFAFRLPAARAAAVNHGVGVEGGASAGGVRQNAGAQPLKNGHDGIVASPKRGAELFHFISVAV